MICKVTTFTPPFPIIKVQKAAGRDKYESSLTENLHPYLTKCTCLPSQSWYCALKFRLRIYFVHFVTSIFISNFLEVSRKNDQLFEDSQKKIPNGFSDLASRKSKRNNCLLIRANFYVPHLTALMGSERTRQIPGLAGGFNNTAPEAAIGIDPFSL